MAKLHATINYEVQQKDKVQRFLDRFANELGRPLLNVQIERYWKTESQFRAKFTISLTATHREGQVFETLQIANSLQRGMWTVNGPHQLGDITFECLFNNEKDDQPLKWAHLELDTEA